MNSIPGILLTYLVVGTLGLLLYILSFGLPIGGDILFYRGLVLAVLVALLMLAALGLAARKHRLAPATIIGAVLTSLSLNICFLVLFPVTIDRSISVFLLATIESRQPLTAAQLERIFSDDYVGTMRQIPRRVREQAISGNIAVSRDGAIRLTRRGERFTALAKSASGWFGTDPRFVVGSRAPTREVPAPRFKEK